MPVVIKRSETGASGNKPAKGAAKSAKNTPAKSAGKAKQAGTAGLSLENQRVKIIGLSTIIVLSLLFMLWWFGVFGGSEERHSMSSPTSVTTGAPGTAGSPGGTTAPGVTLGTKGTGMGAAPG